MRKTFYIGSAALRGQGTGFSSYEEEQPEDEA
jgi:hypothetical protein